MWDFFHAAHLYLIAAREGCVLLKGHRRGTLPGLTAPIQIFISHAVIFSHLTFVQMSRISFLCLKWENQRAGGYGSEVIDRCKMRMLALSVRLWLARHDVLQLRPVGFMSMIGKQWNDTTTPCCSIRTTCIKPDQKGQSLSIGLDKPHHSWAPSTCTACMV